MNGALLSERSLAFTKLKPTKIKQSYKTKLFNVNIFSIIEHNRDIETCDFSANSLIATLRRGIISLNYNKPGVINENTKLYEFDVYYTWLNKEIKASNGNKKK